MTTTQHAMDRSGSTQPSAGPARRRTGGCLVDLLAAALAALLGLVLGAVCFVGLTGCERKPPSDPVIEYTVRGTLAGLPSLTEPNQIYVRHEAIPEYRQTSGRFGMDVMTMPFPLPEQGVSLEGFSVGDPVRVRFAVTYSQDYASLRGYVVTALERLPAETELDFTTLGQLEGFDPSTGRVNAGQ